MHKPYPAGSRRRFLFPSPRSAGAAWGLRLALAGLACASIAPAQAQQQSRQQYDIPAGPLMDALSRYAQESGVVLSLMADQVANLQSRGLHGSYGVDEGFAALLSGTGLDARRGESGYTLAVRPALKGAIELPAVTVTGSQLEGGADQAYRASSASVGVLG